MTIYNVHINLWPSMWIDIPWKSDHHRRPCRPWVQFARSSSPRSTAPRDPRDCHLMKVFGASPVCLKMGSTHQIAIVFLYRKWMNSLTTGNMGWSIFKQNPFGISFPGLVPVCGGFVQGHGPNGEIVLHQKHGMHLPNLELPSDQWT